MDLLALAKAERDRLDKVIALLESGAEKTTAAPARKTKSKNSPTSKSYWTPERRRQMSLKIKGLQKKKAQAAKKA
jgi:hypothetical protein